MWEFAATDKIITQQLAALIAVVAIAIIGVAVLLVPTTYKNIKITSSFLTILEKRYIFKVISLFFMPLLFTLLITDFVGVYAPSYMQTVGLFVLLVFIIIWILYLAISKLVKAVGKNDKTISTQTLERLPFFHIFTMICIISCILACIGALFFVMYPMLNIEISPFNQENVNWAKWFLVDGVAFFVMSIFNFGMTHISFGRISSQNVDNKKKLSKKSIIPITLIILLLVFAMVKTTLNQDYTNSGTSFIRDIFFIPLDMRAYVSINEKQFTLKNESEFDWHSVTISINGEELTSGYTIDLDSVSMNSTVTIDVTEFAMHDGTRLDVSRVKPVRIAIQAHNSLERLGKLFGTLKKE